jgi:hypothetical protein
MQMTAAWLCQVLKGLISGLFLFFAAIFAAGFTGVFAAGRAGLAFVRAALFTGFT